LWELSTGQLLGELENAHYMDIADIDIAVSNDLILTAGKDCKVKLWLIHDLFFPNISATSTQ
jgi:WD40 repeat protein